MPSIISDFGQDAESDARIFIDSFAKQKAAYEKINGEDIANASASTNENSPKEDRVMIFGNSKSGSELVIGDGCEKIATLEKQHFFNFAQ